MMGLALALSLAASPPTPGVGRRIAAAAAAAQALQGPLDGAWRLADRRDQPIYDLQFSDPVGGEGSLSGAWRDIRGGRADPEMGYFARLVRRRSELRLLIPAHGPIPAEAIDLRASPGGIWRGWMGRRAVNLRR